MLPPIASLDEFEDWSSTSITDQLRAAAILAAASTLVRAFAGRAWVDADGEWEAGITDLQQDQVKLVVLSVADRVYRNPRGVTQESTGSFSQSVADWAAFGLALTDDEKLLLGSTQSSGIPGLSSIRVLAPALARAPMRCVSWWEDE